jgi:hypothetical protein
MVKLLIRPQELSGNRAGSHVVQKQEELAKELVNFTSRIISILRWVFQHALKSYDMGPTTLLPFRRKVCCGFLSP